MTDAIIQIGLQIKLMTINEENQNMAALLRRSSQLRWYAFNAILMT